MWSTNEHIDSTINCLLFLLAINFLHLGQFILPIICLIILIDNKFKFKVKNWTHFVILVLFGLSFFFFSFKLGFYSTMGLCLPMAYYIGSNMQRKDEKSIKKLIYLFAFGMGIHIVLNFITDLAIDGLEFVSSISHFDIWTGGVVPTTATAVYSIFVIALLYYFLTHEDNKTYRNIGIVLVTLIIIYDIALGRRTPLLMLILCLVVSFVLDKFIFSHNKQINKKPIIYTIVALVTLILLFVLTYSLNLFGLKDVVSNFSIVKKFVEYGLDTGRIELFIEAIKLMPYHLWGGQQIHNILGIQVHDLWMDTYDYAGIVPFVLLIVHSIMFVVTFVKIIKSKHISSDFKLFISILFFAITIQMFLEPVMTGSSLFIIIVIIIEACLEKAFIHGKKHIK
ncbi:MAG: O-antigen polysaccharide polymerase Wzy [Erysipelotrichaceae bacterium]|nr:O-antigen polysaccharide polymerase Wzy [Erysipelotrichaceae bacterium]